jgi:hypothetical protein
MKSYSKYEKETIVVDQSLTQAAETKAEKLLTSAISGLG